MWVVIGGLFYYLYQRELQNRRDNVNHQLSFICDRIIATQTDGSDIKTFVDFIKDYLDNSRFDEIRISVYDGNDKLIYSGRDQPFRVPDEVINDFNSGTATGRVYNSDTQRALYVVRKSEDGNIVVHATMPWTNSRLDSLNVDSSIYYMLAISLLAVMLLAYFSTGFIVKNVKMLREFARNSNNPDFTFDEARLGHDELGDISRDIIRLYSSALEANRRSEREHAVALHAIEEKARMQHQLTNNINHELKTPVGVIRGYLETVLSADDMDADTKKYFLKRALDNVERLCSLLNDVSTMTRLENGSTKIPMTEVNIHDLVYAIHNDMKQADNLGKMTFEFNIPLECNVMANASLLTSTISNLMRNAVIHSHGTKMGMDLISESDKFYTFTFWDNGQGVGEEHIPHLFERFYRADAGRSRKSGGTGLGLPIVKNTIESLGGALSVYNRSEGGLKFLFTLKKARNYSGLIKT